MFRKKFVVVLAQAFKGDKELLGQDVYIFPNTTTITKEQSDEIMADLLDQYPETTDRSVQTFPGQI